MTWSGSYENRGDQAAGAALLCGATPLEALLCGDIGSYGDTCWLTDAKQATLIVQRNGRNPHPRSVARARRNARDKGILEYKRVMPGHKPSGARFTSTAGTTAKTINFKALATRDPLTRGQRRRIRLRQQSVEQGCSACESEVVSKDLSKDVPPIPGEPRHSVPVRASNEKPKGEPAKLDAELASIIAEATANMQAKWQREDDREDAKMMASVVAGRKRPKPPD